MAKAKTKDTETTVEPTVEATVETTVATEEVAPVLLNQPAPERVEPGYGSRDFNTVI